MNSEVTLEDSNTYTKKDNPKKRITPERSSQTYDEVQQDRAKLCFNKFKLFEEKLDKVLLILPDFDHLKARVVKLEELKLSITECLQFMLENF